MDMLNRHPRITAKAEVLVNLKEDGADAQARWLEKLYHPLNPWIKAVGHKTKLWDVVDLDGFSESLQKYNVHTIVLSRQSALKAVVSAIRSAALFENTGRWELVKDKDRLGVTAVDPADVVERLKSWEYSEHQLNAFVGKLDTPRLDLNYETLVSDTADVLARVSQFLGVKVNPKQLMKSRIKKLTSDDLRDVVDNYEEMVDEICEAGFSRYVDVE